MARALMTILLRVAVLLVAMLVVTQQENIPCLPADAGNDVGVCGFNGICAVSSGSSLVCTCPPGFDFFDKGNHSKGCVQNSSQLQSCSATGAEMQSLEGVDFPGSDYLEMRSTNETACEQACLEDCYCKVSIFGLDDNGTETCWKKAMPLRFSLPKDSRTSFIKVYSGVSKPGVSPNPPKERKDKGKALTVIGVSLVGCSFVFAAILLLIWLYALRPKLRDTQKYHNFINPVGLRTFSYQEINAATGGFKKEIGRGAFGKVYKGILSDGREIAVKKLDDLVKEGGQHEDGDKEFRTEMGIIGASHHKNLVELYGFCTEGSHRLLIYQYMPNGSLDKFLFKGTRDLSWEVRAEIVLGTARGILYLHEECKTPIIHCDIKPQNILLDENYRAKIADFGISKLIGVEQTRTFTVARGTVGYIAPEWQKSMAITVKVDVYSFGVVLLEIVCCRKMFELHAAEDEMVLCDWVYDCFKYGQLLKLVEQQDGRGVDSTQLERMVLVGLWCIQEDSSLRPSMKRVVQMLEGTVEISVPPHPDISSS